MGTSPRARGKLELDEAATDDDGNIPACAGKTLMSWPRGGVMPEHPRVRGENRHLAGRMAGRMGTSPRARGKRPSSMSVSTGVGNIPACAGKTYPH